MFVEVVWGRCFLTFFLMMFVDAVCCRCLCTILLTLIIDVVCWLCSLTVFVDVVCWGRILVGCWCFWWFWVLALLFDLVCWCYLLTFFVDIVWYRCMLTSSLTWMRFTFSSMKRNRPDCICGTNLKPTLILCTFLLPVFVYKFLERFLPLVALFYDTDDDLCVKMIHHSPVRLLERNPGISLNVMYQFITQLCMRSALVCKYRICELF